jgi:polyhydroxybutyrate depolymerase
LASGHQRAIIAGMARSIAVLVCTLAIVLAACAAETPSGTAETSSGSTEFVAGGDRPVTVHVPATADPSGAPLLLVLHGYTSDGAEVKEWLRLGEAADKRGVVWAYPDGTKNAEGEQFWDATPACCAFGEVEDDSAYLAGLIDEIAATTPIDPKRVYVAGHSNGGFMSHRMACDHADRIAAIAPISGVTFDDPADCAASAPVAVVQVHGTDDDVIRYDGGDTGSVTRTYPSVAETADSWLAINGCDEGLTETTRRIDVDAEVNGTDGPAETTVAESTGCDPGGRVEVWTVHGVGHVPTFTASLPDTLLDALLAYARP